MDHCDHIYRYIFIGVILIKLVEHITKQYPGEYHEFPQQSDEKLHNLTTLLIFVRKFTGKNLADNITAPGNINNSYTIILVNVECH
jgi:hypothetical protein